MKLYTRYNCREGEYIYCTNSYISFGNYVSKTNGGLVLSILLPIKYVKRCGYWWQQGSRVCVCRPLVQFAFLKNGFQFRRLDITDESYPFIDERLC